MSDVFNNTVIVLPSLNPDEKFEYVLSGLLSGGFKNIVIVNDGSDSDKLHYFEEASSHSECTVLTHEVNLGKGRALKDAFIYIHDNFPGVNGVITIDGDGQHLLKDIISCGQCMLDNPGKVIMGCRDFDLDIVPKKSRVGNKFTAFMFRFVCGIKLSDTQTGLRAIPYEYLADFSEIKGERFDYETNMLLEMKKNNIGFIEQKIETVYEDENKRSHYRPLRDSWRIFKVMFKFVLSSFAAQIIDLGVFALAFSILGGTALKAAELLSTVIARIVSSVFNFVTNKKLVFKSKDSISNTVKRYYALCIPQMLVSAGLITLLNNITGNSSTGMATLFKCIVDFILFLISYQIQRDWVFCDK